MGVRAGWRKEATGKDLHFSYVQGEEVLRGLDFHAGRGERVAPGGPTGSGKRQTLINLLFRFYDPDSGSLRLDGAGEPGMEPEGPA